MGGAGMFAVSVYMMFMGGYYDRLVANKLPAGAEVSTYANAAAESPLASSYNEAKKAAGPEIINITLIIPIILIVAFILLNLYMRRRKATSREVLQTA
jgi:hypothetical protein